MYRLNDFELTPDFPFEQETNNTLLFLDILQIDNNNKLDF